MADKQGIGIFAGRGTCPSCLDRHLDDQLDSEHRLLLRSCRACNGVALIPPAADTMLEALGAAADLQPPRKGSALLCPGCGKRMMWRVTVNAHELARCIVCKALWLDDARMLPSAVREAFAARVASTSEALSERERARMAAASRYFGAAAQEEAERAAANRTALLAHGAIVGEPASAWQERRERSRASSAAAKTETAKAALESFDDPAVAAAERTRLQAEREARRLELRRQLRQGLILAIALGTVIGAVTLAAWLGWL